MTLRLGVLASGNGSNFQAILDACASSQLDATVQVLVGNNSKAFAFDRARAAGIPSRHISAKTHPNPEALDAAICETLQDHHVNLVCLAGYMKKLGPQLLRSFHNRILNIHRAPLPQYGGEGMYGDAILEALLRDRATEGGATVHLVDEEYDHGRILAFKPMPIRRDDTVETLAARVLTIEHQLYPATLQRIASGELDLDADS